MSASITDAKAPSAEAAPMRASNRVKAIMGACSGNLVEWYDIFIYAYRHLHCRFVFPQGGHHQPAIEDRGVFAVGFFMRPLGG